MTRPSGDTMAIVDAAGATTGFPIKRARRDAPTTVDAAVATTFERSPSVGSRIGQYEVLSAIAAGGMGKVYRARDSRLGRDVALKVLPDLLAADPERRARLDHEARMVAALNHPNIVTIYSVEESDGTRFLTMEFVEGQTLDALLPPRGLPLPELLTFIFAPDIFPAAS